MRSAETFLCVDFGSTFTKALLVSAAGEVLGAAEHRTTIDTDVMDGFDAIAAQLPGATEVLACSSAGGGLRILVIGQEELVTAEAGRRVALSSGGAVVG
ncbi:MAG: glutamate mutase, partial [Myxococcales bacterium]